MKTISFELTAEPSLRCLPPPGSVRDTAKLISSRPTNAQSHQTAFLSLAGAHFSKHMDLLLDRWEGKGMFDCAADLALLSTVRLHSLLPESVFLTVSHLSRT